MYSNLLSYSGDGAGHAGQSPSGWVERIVNSTVGMQLYVFGV